MIPQTATTVYADSDKTISGLCTGTIGNPTEGAGGWSKVYYGNYGSSAMLYRVLTTSTTDFGGSTMLLDFDGKLVNKKFDESSKIWANSEIKSWLNGSDFYGSTDVFTTQEKAAIAESTKASAASGDGNGWSSLGYAPLAGEYVFLLDAKEATRPSYGYANTNESDANRKKSGTATYWWLRSPYSGNADYAGYVYSSGKIEYDFVYNGIRSVSPAFNLNLSSVIFSSEVSDGYKLTVKDENMTIAQTGGSDVTRSGNVVTVPYTISGTNSGNATQVSVLLTNSAYSAGTVATTGYSYQKLNVTTWGTSGTGTFTLPAAYADESCGTDYYAYILAEDVNTGNATDYASTPATITIPDATAEQVATPTFSPAEGTYTEAQNVTISCTTNGATIHYTTDGSDPTTSSPTYSNAISVSDTTTIKAIAVKTGMTNSSVASATYTINIPGTVATPTFTPAAGTYSTAQNVAISCTTDGATIHYTTDGTAPTAASATYNDPINVRDTMTIKAIAVKNGLTDSSVASATYTISATPVDTCTITFEPNGGRGSMEPQTVDKGVRTRLNRNSFTRRGYSFDGWNTRADGKGTGYDDRDHVTVNDNITLYAQWEKEKHKDDDDDHDDEPAPSNNNNTKVPDGCDELRQSLSSAIATAAVSGKPQTVYWNKGTSLPYDVMKMLHDNPNVTLVFSYTYLRQNYTVTIPGSAAIANPAVPWYGPVYLYALYGNTKIPALTTNTKAATGNYTVKSGDTLSAIAKRLKTTVKHLKDVNNIKNVDRIKPGMVLKY